MGYKSVDCGSGISYLQKVRRVPSVKTLSRIGKCDIRELRLVRRILRAADAELEDLIQRHAPRTAERFRDSHPLSQSDLRRLHAANELLHMHGVEAIIPTRRKPLFLYLNTGESYAATLMLAGGHGGRWRVADWGSIAERGGYA